MNIGDNIGTLKAKLKDLADVINAFKSEAVWLTRESGRPVAQVARELGISDNVLYRWRSEQQQVDSQGRTGQAVRAEQD